MPISVTGISLNIGLPVIALFSRTPQTLESQLFALLSPMTKYSLLPNAWLIGP